MEKIILFTKTHWKKLGMISLPVVYGSEYVKEEYQASQHMRHVCKVVNQYSAPRDSKVLVVLNPVANGKRCEKQFQKYCEPILHMAGYAVEVVKTNHIGHAKSLMEALQQLPDIVVVAGGDGTSSEVVTGLIRRNENICPVLFLPLGEKNETAFSLMGLNGESKFVKNVSQCMLALVQGRIEQRPVVKYELIEDDYSESHKPIFGILTFSWGLLRDIEIDKEKYWYFGIFKYHFSVLIAALSNKVNKNILANILSTPPCLGCSKCETFDNNKPWFNVSKLLNPHLPSKYSKQLKNTELCSTQNYSKINAKQIDIVCMQNSDSCFSLHGDIIENISSRFDFFFNMTMKNKIMPTTILESRTMEIIPLRSDHQTYYIDGESYDARHIKISFLPNALKYFC